MTWWDVTLSSIIKSEKTTDVVLDFTQGREEYYYQVKAFLVTVFSCTMEAVGRDREDVFPFHAGCSTGWK